MNHQEFRLSQKEVGFHPAEAISANSKLNVLVDQEIIADYFKRHVPAYQDELDALLSHQNDRGVKDFYVIIPSRGEAGTGNLEKTLSLYSGLEDVRRCKLVVFENHPIQENRDSASAVIQRIVQRYPQLEVIHLYKAFPEPPTIGMVRKLATDFVLLQKYRSRRQKGIILVSHDADAEYIPKDYLRHLDKIFKDKRIDAVGGDYEYLDEVYERIPILKPLISLPKELRKMIRAEMAKKGTIYAPSMIGANSAFRSGIYAAIGGYDPDLKRGEDSDLGRRIFAARKKARKSGESTIVSSDEITIVTNARRAIWSIVGGIPFNSRHLDFHTNQALRTDSSHVQPDIYIPMDAKQLEASFQGAYDTLLSPKKIEVLGQETYDQLFVTAVRNIGYRCTVKNRRVALTVR